MFAEYFHAAAAHLRSIGKNPEIQDGEPVSESDLDMVEGIIQRPIPAELRAWFLEMGNGYSFSPGENHDGFVIGWLGDYRYKVAGFGEVLQEEAARASRNPPEVVERELRRRERWFPFYNFGAGGYTFCLDLNESPAPVRYYERVYWADDRPATWEFSAADSFHELVRQWSRFCFANLTDGDLVGYASGAVGWFDWAPARFDPIYDRGSVSFRDTF